MKQALKAIGANQETMHHIVGSVESSAAAQGKTLMAVKANGRTIGKTIVALEQGNKQDRQILEAIHRTQEVDVRVMLPMWFYSQFAIYAPCLIENKEENKTQA